MDLPDDLSLPLDRGAPWWYWLAGRPALDFVNTRRERWRRNVETLVTPEDLAEWVVQAGLLAEPPPVDRELLFGRAGACARRSTSPPTRSSGEPLPTTMP